MGTQIANCRIFTPPDVVIHMMDILGYKENLYGRKILENSCGDGRFLTEIVKRYIEDCRRNGYNNDEIRNGLARDIYAYEIDTDTFNECIKNLNQLVTCYSIFDVKWSVFNNDALKAELSTDFSFVVGNPPYITYSALSADDRAFIRQTFTVCKEGKPDYYYAFIESALNCLRSNGRMVYLLPSNFFKTRFALKVREYLLPSLTEIYDYKQQKIFDSALTASAVIACNKGDSSTYIIYHDVATKMDSSISKESLKERWVFIPKPLKEKTKKQVRFGDRYPASGSIATLHNNAFIFDSDAPDLAQIEPEIVRKAASPKSESTRKDKSIIFPYFFDERGKLQRYAEEDFSQRFPKATAHLNKYRDHLDARSSDKKAKWFEYGRSQAIGHMNKEKLLLSTVITGKVNVTMLDEKTIPYSGIYIVAKDGFDLLEAKRILESRPFLEYAKAVGVQANGASIRISISDINNYLFALP